MYANEEMEEPLRIAREGDDAGNQGLLTIKCRSSEREKRASLFQRTKMARCQDEKRIPKQIPFGELANTFFFEEGLSYDLDKAARTSRKVSTLIITRGNKLQRAGMCGET